jgi:hypothetical protein
MRPEAIAYVAAGVVAMIAGAVMIFAGHVVNGFSVVGASLVPIAVAGMNGWKR